MRGVNVYAKQCVDGRDRKRVERLCRYITRPPVANERLTERADGTLELTLKSPWKDGTRAVVLTGRDLLTRLVAAVPPPRFHTVRYFGVLSSHSKLRSEVVPTPPEPPEPDPEPGAQLDLELALGEERDEEPRRKPWAWLLAHVFLVDVTVCPRCGGKLKWLEVATSGEAIRRVLAEHGVGARAPPDNGPRGQLELEFG